MNRQSNRTAWVKYGVLAALVAGGGAGGVYLSGGRHDRVDPIDNDPPLALSADVPWTHRFPLTPADAKDGGDAPGLAVDPAGRVFVAWASKTGDAERTVFLARSEGAGQPLLPPQVVGRAGVYRTPGRGKSGGHERRPSPHVVCDGDRVHLAWGAGLPDGSGVRMDLLTSTDAGASFGAPQPVHRGERAKPTFVSAAHAPGGRLAFAWLDDRAGTQQPFAAVRTRRDESFDPERVVYPGQDGKGVCPCCPTAATFGPDGTLYVAFRNIHDGYRDTAVCRLKPGADAFDGPFPVVPDTWKFDGCPHDGPSLAVVGDELHVVWMDARSGPQRCYHSRAKLTDMAFTARELNSAGPGTQGNARLFADTAGGLHVVWEESLGAEPAAAPAGHAHGPPTVGTGSGRAIMHAHLPAGGTAFGPPRSVAPRAGAFQTRPAITGGPGGAVFVAWNELDESGKAVVVTRLANAAGTPEGAGRD